MGSSLYGFVGAWVPRGLVAWMMGVRRVDAHGSEGEFGRSQGQALIMDGNSKGKANETHGEEAFDARHPNGFALDEDGGYISVHGERDEEDLGDGHGF